VIGHFAWGQIQGYYHRHLGATNNTVNSPKCSRIASGSAPVPAIDSPCDARAALGRSHVHARRQVSWRDPEWPRIEPRTQTWSFSGRRSDRMECLICYIDRMFSILQFYHDSEASCD
jgi:hypothetical protein